MKKTIFAALCVMGAFASCGDVVLENAHMRLTLGDDAVVKSLVVKPSGVECVDSTERLPLFSVTQDRPFNNEIKLTYPNTETTYPANRVSREGDILVVGFETAPYEARVRVKEASGYILFELAGFVVEPSDYGSLNMKTPPVKSFRLVQLPVKDRANFGDWLNVMWDDDAATAVVAAEPMTVINGVRRNGFHLFTADVCRDLKLVGAKAAIVSARTDAFLNSLSEMEDGCGLPNGVKSRQSPKLNASIYWSSFVTPKTVDENIALAKQGGFKMMLLYYPCIVKGADNDWGYAGIGGYELLDDYVNGIASLTEMLDKIKAAGITPGLHVLQTFIGFKSSYVTPVADHRLNIVRRFTLSRGLDTSNGDVYVEEDPSACPLADGTRILKFGGELLSYEGFVAERPYRFTGVKRGDKKTNVTPHAKGTIGGLLDVCEFGAESCYIDQNTTLQDEIAEKIARIYNAGFEFMYFDGSEGVNAPHGIHVPNAQYKVVSRMNRPPLFTEGAAKAHFDWHFLGGANAFDVFQPEEFKPMIVKWPQHEAPIMRRNFSRLNFGWWGLRQPKSKLRDGRISVGTQPDMWEFGTSRAAAWDCPATLQVHEPTYRKHPRIDDLMEVMRRWEDVRAKNWLTPAQKEALKSQTQEHHLYLNGNGEYELHEIEMLPSPVGAKDARAFAFKRNGKSVLACWHMSGSGTMKIAFGADGKCRDVSLAGMTYLESDLSIDGLKAAYAAAVMP